MDKEYIIQKITEFAFKKGIPVSTSIRDVNIFLESLDQLMKHKQQSSLQTKDIVWLFQTLFPVPISIQFQDKINAQVFPQTEHLPP